jgi:hypothetical protein
LTKGEIPKSYKASKALCFFYVVIEKLKTVQKSFAFF